MAKEISKEVTPLEITQVKDIATVPCLPLIQQTDSPDNSCIDLKSESFLTLSFIDKAIFIAESVSSRIKNKHEPVELMIVYNTLLQEHKDELIRTIAAVDSDTRSKMIKSLFLEVVRAVHNE